MTFNNDGSELSVAPFRVTTPFSIVATFAVSFNAVQGQLNDDGAIEALDAMN